MRLPIEWIKEYAPVEADAEELGHRLTMAGLEVEETEASSVGPVLNITVTPNRGDCLSAIGVAREVAASFGVAMKPAPVAESGDTGEGAILTSVIIEDPDLCPRYAARIIRGVQPKSSPDWMQARLTAAGMRPVSGIVDVTNYVMLEMGQPLHAFDYDRLAGNRIVVRRARPGETIRTLDGVDRTLTTDNLMICDAAKPVAVAGVMGGAATEMNLRTKTVLLESAHFNPLSVRRTARALNLRTEASMRFERVVDPNLVAAASDRTCALIRQLGMGEPTPGIVDVYPNPAAERILTIRPGRATLLLGFDVTAGQVAQTLERLGFVGKKSPPLPLSPSPAQTFRVPGWRPDIVREEDIVEEVGRVLGYEHIPETLPHGSSTQGRDSDEARFAERVREVFAGAGLQEVVTHALLAPGPYEDSRDSEQRIGIRSALSAELSGLRRSLLPGLIDALERNARRGQSPLAFFEIGKVFHKDADEYSEQLRAGGLLAGPLASEPWQRQAHQGPADYFLAMGIVESILRSVDVRPPTIEPSCDPRLHPGRAADLIAGSRKLGFVGELHPDLARELTVHDRVIIFDLEVDYLRVLSEAGQRFTPLSPYPAVVRDLAPRVATEVHYASVEAAVQSAGVYILERVTLTDLYTGNPVPEGQKSFTLSFTFRAPDRTLTDEEVNDALARIRTSLESTCGATFVA